ncbi:class I SAM-dependent methyltransferase [Photobacterium sp. SDRW27]|uniref:class I SAM-dependent methyltransferase n=1 Tax=Photobacterium obscurum TaxID=2829490 RepID=UPI002244552F|nr:class I SAM-dependent methyltransferase [Photobacterium obscurum]MCW8327693.1 class I SAM-dependent methyltransferase [Photobacterium obscurum]
MNVIAFITFAVVQILFIPLVIIGLVMVFYKQVYVSKKLDVASTAVEVINGRWTMHVFGLREDEASCRLNRVLPNNSLFGLWLILFPSYLRYRMSGQTHGYPAIPEREKEGLSHLVTARTVYFDQLIEKHIDSIEQLVVMGAGFDTRCYGKFKHKQIRYFELDQVNTQKLKISSLDKAGIDISHVNFVDVDFFAECWYAKLHQAGFDPGKKTLFLWEGVTLYLDERSVRQALREIRQHSALGSVVVCDIYANRFVEGTYVSGMKSSLKVLKVTGEGLGFGLNLSENAVQVLSDFMASEGMLMKERYLMGEKTEKGIFMVVLEAIVTN